MKLWENYKTLDKESSFKSYLFTIAYNYISKLFRRRKYQIEFIEYAMCINFQSSTESEDRIDSRYLLERVRTIIEKLPERQKTIFLKTRMEFKSTREIAEEVGLSPGTVDNY